MRHWLALLLAVVTQAVFAQQHPPLLAAAARGDAPALQRLLSGGADLETRNEAGETALYLAAEKGRLEAVRLLLERRADPNARTANGETPLALARRRGHESVVKLLARSS